MKQFIWIIMATALMASCRSTRKIGTAISRKDTTMTIIKSSKNLKRDSITLIKESLRGLAAHHIDFNSFSAKVNIDYRGTSDKNYNVNAVIRMYKDSAIWISANALLGIEALRVLITKDSVRILNKLTKTYTARSVDYLQEETALPLDLKTVQDLIIGNPVYFDSSKVVSYSRGNNTISLLSYGQWFKNLLTISETDQSLQHSRLDDLNAASNRTAELNYSDYDSKKGPFFSTKRQIIVSDIKKLEIRIDFRQYDFNDDVSFPFSVPKNYKRN